MRYANRLVVLASLIFVLAMWSLSAHAQLNQGSLVGQVTDSTGAAIPQAQISARNINTGVVVKNVSSQVGEFRFPALPLGTYDVSVSMTGFQRASRALSWNSIRRLH